MLVQEQWSMKPKLLVTLPSKQVVQYSENPLRKKFPRTRYNKRKDFEDTSYQQKKGNKSFEQTNP